MQRHANELNEFNEIDPNRSFYGNLFILKPMKLLHAAYEER